MQHIIRGKVMKRKEKMLKRAMACNPADEKGNHVFYTPQPDPKRNLRKRKSEAGKLITFKDF